MGVVYLARQINLGRSVAVKMLAGDLAARGSALERFRREALAVARQVCAALAAAHAAGVIHRDLKPSNIFLEEGAHGVTAKVLDFGIAKLRDAEGLTIDRITAAGAVVGTPIYMSPEQCEGRELDARTDLYSLGCVLFEMLAGRPPFLADSLFAAVRMHTSQPPEPPSRFAPGLPAVLDAVVLRLLAKQPRDRFPSTAEVATALTVVGRTIVRAPDDAPSTRPPPRRRHRRGARVERVEPAVAQRRLWRSCRAPACDGTKSGLLNTRLPNRHEWSH